MRAVHEHMMHIAQDLGGASELSRIESDLAVRFAFVCEQLEKAESDALAGKSIDHALYLSRIDRAVRLAQLLGLERRAKPLPTLREYLAAKVEREQEQQSEGSNE